MMASAKIRRRDAAANAQQIAQACTDGFVDLLESHIEGDRQDAVIYCSSAIAAAIRVFERYGYTPEEIGPVLHAIWLGEGGARFDS